MGNLGEGGLTGQATWPGGEGCGGRADGRSNEQQLVTGFQVD